MAKENLKINGQKGEDLKNNLFKQGVSSAIYQLFLAFDNKAVDVAILAYLLKDPKNIIAFKNELDEAYEKIDFLKE